MSGNLWQPTNVDEIRAVLQRTKTPSVLRGSGNSSVNVSLNGAGLTIDLSRLKKMEWDLERGVVYVEPGVTVYELCCQALAQGFWPYVVPMMVQATLGDSLSVNAYGANPYKQGPIGKYIESFDLLLASGELLNVSALQEELFYSVIGGFGLLGVVTNIAIQLQTIASNDLFIHHCVVASLSDMISIFDEQALLADYLIGWIDGYATGDQVGCGVVTSGKYVDEHELQYLKSNPSRVNAVSDNTPSMPWLMRSIMKSGGVKAANALYYNAISMRSREEPYQCMPLVDFHSCFHPWYHPLHVTRHMEGYFFQPCVPAAKARNILPQLLEYSRQAGFIPFRCILRRHRSDPFKLSYQIDGFSLELVYAVNPEKNARLMNLLKELHEQVIQEGGRFYPARDVALSGSSYARSIGEENVQKFRDLKKLYDPNTRFVSSLYQRLFC